MKLFLIIFYLCLIGPALTWGDNVETTARNWRKVEDATVDELIADLRNIISLAKIREQENKVTISDLSDENRQLARQLQEQINKNEANIKNLKNSFSELEGKWTNAESSLRYNAQQYVNLQTKINSLTQNITTIVAGGGQMSKRRDMQYSSGLEHLKKTGSLVNVEGEWFYFRSYPWVYWAHASSLCHELGMRMVILDTHEKNEKIFNYLKKNKQFTVKHFWIGAIRLTKHDGTYEYVWQNTLQPVNENSWDYAQPGGHYNEECVEIWGDANKLSWNNIHCYDVNGVICEMIN